MNLILKKAILLSIVLLLGFSLGGCLEINTNKEESHSTLSESRDYERVESIEVDIKMGVGELKVTGGAEDIFEGDFIYSIGSWKPEIDYKVTKGIGHLSIEQPSKINKITIGSQKYQWDIALHDEAPMDLNVKLGVGASELSLGSLNLHNLDIEMGVGETKVDLRGDWEEDASVDIEGGIGKATILLPKDIGVQVEVDGGIGSVRGEGLIKEGNTYQNDLYNNSPITLTIDIEAGIGEVELK